MSLTLVPETSVGPKRRVEKVNDIVRRVQLIQETQRRKESSDYIFYLFRKGHFINGLPERILHVLFITNDIFPK